MRGRVVKREVGGGITSLWREDFWMISTLLNPHEPIITNVLRWWESAGGERLYRLNAKKVRLWSDPERHPDYQQQLSGWELSPGTQQHACRYLWDAQPVVSLLHGFSRIIHWPLWVPGFPVWAQTCLRHGKGAFSISWQRDEKKSCADNKTT